MIQKPKIEIDSKLISISYWKKLPWYDLEEILRVTYSSDSLPSEFVRILLQAALETPVPPDGDNPESYCIEAAINHHGFYLVESYYQHILAAIEVGCGFNGDIMEYQKALYRVLLNSMEFEDQIADNEKVPPELEKQLLSDTLHYFPPPRKHEWILFQISEFVDQQWQLDHPDFEFDDSKVLADNESLIHMISSIKEHNPLLIREVLQILSRKGMLREIPNRKGAMDIVENSGWSTLREILSELSNRVILQVLEMPELNGLLIPIDFFLSMVPNDTTFDDGCSEIYSKVLTALEKQIQLGGPTFEIDVDRMQTTQAARLIPAVLEKRKSEINSLQLKIDERGYINIESLNDTFYGRKLVESCGISKEVEFHILDEFNTELEKSGMKIKVSNLDGVEVIKVLVCGPKSCGKRSILKRFVLDSFDSSPEDEYSFIYMKEIRIDNQEKRMFLWDPLIWGPFLFGKCQYYGKGKTEKEDLLDHVQAMLLVYALDDRTSFESLKLMFERLCEDLTDVPPIAVVGNKSDEKGNKHSVMYLEEGKQLAEELSKRYNIPTLFIEVSAKLGENIDELFLELVRIIMSNKSAKT